MPKSEKNDEIEEIEEVQPSEEKGKTKGFVWTPEIIKEVLDFIKDLANKYLTFKKDDAQARQRRFEARAKHNRNMVIGLLVFLSVIVVGMSFLTMNGNVSGDALLFLVGTITGYVLLFIQRLVFTSEEEEPSIPEL